MPINEEAVGALIERLRKQYPDWSGFGHAGFERDEVTYKQATVKKAHDLLGRDEFARLLEAEASDEIIARLEKLGRDNNLLFLQVPMQGDLQLLYHPKLDKREFCHVMYALLHGMEDIAQRFAAYLEYLDRYELPSRWTFDTYFLFIFHPESELFIKPSVTKRFLKLVGANDVLSKKPTVESYLSVRQIAHELRELLRPYGPRDMVDIQGLLWCLRMDDTKPVSTERLAEFAKLFAEFRTNYLEVQAGVNHRSILLRAREDGRKNVEECLTLPAVDATTADQVLLKLLPYNDSEGNRSRGAWISMAPAVTKDIKTWFEGAGWAKPEDWVRIAETIVEFLRRITQSPETFTDACRWFDETVPAKGFQSGIVSPIINAIDPDAYPIINSKSRKTLEYFTGLKQGREIRDYPNVARAERELVATLKDVLDSVLVPGLNSLDIFDMFCHWLVAVKKFFKVVDEDDEDKTTVETRYWKIAPGEHAKYWDAWREGNYISIGWGAIGDVSQMDRPTFEKHKEEATHREKWEKGTGPTQVWKFAKEIKIGDRVVANRGFTEVVGIGTVIGPYYYVPNEDHGHRIPVEWNDLNPRKVEQKGWRPALKSLDEDVFNQIFGEPLPPASIKDLAPLLSDVFADLSEANMALDLMLLILKELGVSAANDARVALNLHKNKKSLNLSFGPWLMCGVNSPSKPARRILIPLVNQASYPPEVSEVSVYAWGDRGSDVTLYALPLRTELWEQGPVREGLLAALGIAREQFTDWSKSPYWRPSSLPINIILHNDARADFFKFGVADTPPHPECPFSRETFELLEGIHRKPTQSFHAEHKDDFARHVEGPLKELFSEAAAHLDDKIRVLIETEKGVYAKFAKNDFGKGGAWDFFWGAFYPKGGKRTEDAQLFIVINRDWLRLGFAVGEYAGEQQQRFVKNAAAHRDALRSILTPLLEEVPVVYGDPKRLQELELDDGPGLSEWLKAPAHYGVEVFQELTSDQVLACSRDQLVELVRSMFRQVFPFVLLAINDDPMRAIGDYLGRENDFPDNPPCSLREIERETGFAAPELKTWVEAIHRKGQAVFYGPPGTGKTFLAQRVARHLVGEGNGFIELVQFHPAYSYEDFIQGIRPQVTASGLLEYKMVPGRLLGFCDRARERSGVCVLIIDEINRANLARVFGEVMYLLEYRNEAIPLAGGAKNFAIPDNVRIIGTMNTADRSIALVDHALRRRFAFFRLDPRFEVLQAFHARHNGFAVEGLADILKRINDQIGDENYSLGISFFLQEHLDSNIQSIWMMEIEPYLEEYFFDQPEKVAEFRWDKVKGKILP